MKDSFQQNFVGPTAGNETNVYNFYCQYDESIYKQISFFFLRSNKKYLLHSIFQMLMLIFFLTEHFVVIAQFIEYFILFYYWQPKKNGNRKLFPLCVQNIWQSVINLNYLAFCHYLSTTKRF